MKKLVTGALALSILTTMSMAEGIYFGGGINNIDVGLSDNGIGFETKIGKVFYNHFGVEGQISKTFSSSEEKVDGIDFKVESMAISAFATYNHQLTPEFTIMPKIGFSQYSMDASLGSIDESDSSLGFAFGIDIKYQVTNDIKMYASISKYYPKLDKPIGQINYRDGSYRPISFDKDLAPRHISIGVEKIF